MDRKTIEEKDKHLLKEIRRIVRYNHGKTKIAKPFWRAPVFWMAVFFFVIIGIGLTAFRQKPTMIAPKNGTSPSDIRVKKAPFSTTEVSAKQSDTTDVEFRAQLAEELEKKENVSVAPQDEGTENLPSPAPLEKTPATTQMGKKADTADQTGTEQPQAKIESYNIRIRKIVTCKGIHEKQYVLEKSSFSLKEKVNPTVWMSVRSDTQPFTLTHAYFLNDHRYCEVPLEIRYQRMRTWSHVTLNDEKQLGHWRVEVLTDDGNRLAKVEFTVVP